jgi:hypothetical protein|tara:strand:+ start:655 stop:1737 length:1083 start_codon:yes stop_codon:yes gene_type:complete
MTKFLNKKEQVYDLELTSYGRYLLSIGTFKPTYYTFLDDNIIYDIKYTSTASAAPIPHEPQSHINKRIKEETSYRQSQVFFRDVEDTLTSLDPDSISYVADTDTTPTMVTPAEDIFKFNSVIGDALLDGEAQATPAWKLLMLQGNISSSIYRATGRYTPAVGIPPIEQEAREGILMNSQIPQINMTASYTLKVIDAALNVNPESARSLTSYSLSFADKKVIRLEMKDPMMYVEEFNTEMLTENFDIEVFEVESGSVNGLYSPLLHRKYFERQVPQIENGFMLMEAPVANEAQNLTTASIEYYFDVLRDASVNQVTACLGMEEFNKKSYYIDMDFSCDTVTQDAVFYDIYGSVTEPEICQD